MFLPNCKLFNILVFYTYSHHLLSLIKLILWLCSVLFYFSLMPVSSPGTDNVQNVFNINKPFVIKLMRGSFQIHLSIHFLFKICLHHIHLRIHSEIITYLYPHLEFLFSHPLFCVANRLYTMHLNLKL